MRPVTISIMILNIANMTPARNEASVAKAYNGSGSHSRQLQGHFTGETEAQIDARWAAYEARVAAYEAQQASNAHSHVASRCETHSYEPQLTLTLPEKTCAELWEMTPGELTAYLKNTGNLNNQGDASSILAPPTWDGGLIVTSATHDFDPCVRTQTPQAEAVYRVFIDGDIDVFREVVYTQKQPVDQRCIVPEEPHDWYLKDYYWSGGLKPNMVLKASDGYCLEVTTGTAINGPFNYDQANESDSICNQYMNLARGSACDESLIEPCPTNTEDEPTVVVAEDASHDDDSRSTVVSSRDRNQTHNNSTDGVRSVVVSRDRNQTHNNSTDGDRGVVVTEDTSRDNDSRSAGSRGANEGPNSDKGKRKKVNGGEEANKTMSRLLIAGFAFAGVSVAGASRKIANVLGCSRKGAEPSDVEMQPLLSDSHDVNEEGGITLNPVSITNTQ